ncbi:MAG: response regulator [Thermoplasmatota archaeon]|nr:response regulator [Halobacteriales archaeon]
MVDILWAEDNPLDRQLIEEALADLPGAPSVSFAEDGEELLRRLRTERPVLVVLDIKMPRVTGIEALDRMRRDAKLHAMPVVIFSSSNQPSEMDTCRRLGVRDYVQKPIEFGALQAAVRRVVGWASAVSPRAGDAG